MIATALVATAFACSLSAATLYVSLESGNPVAPFATWETAARVIQDAVDAAQAGDTVLVTNGVYANGGRAVGTSILVNRVAVEKPLTLQSVNGPQFTLIEGAKAFDTETSDGAVRCVYLADGASLSGFSLTNGATPVTASSPDVVAEWDGGGACCASSNVAIRNCLVTGNSAGGSGGGVFGGALNDCVLVGNSGRYGSGAANCRLYNCRLENNSGAHEGGGAAGCWLNYCTLRGNSANGLCKSTLGGMPCGQGGGAANSTLYNCSLANNSANYRAGGAVGCALLNCILTGNSPGSDSTFYNCTVIDNEGGISGTAFNSIIYYNSGGNYAEGTTLNNCCTTPLPTNGIGNITGPPLFMDMTAGDFRLREDSPCIDAGTNLLSVAGYSFEPTDILGNTRFIDGNGDGKVAWDIGAYEFNSFKPPRFSVFPQLTADGWQLSVTGAPSKWVHLQRSGNLKDWQDIWSGFMGAEGLQQVNDRDTGPKAMFYRVIVP